MAIYHFNGKIVTRSAGKSAVAAAAYRSGERMHDERHDKTYDYTKKHDVVDKEILLPEGAPEWMKDREQLWNAVESFERRKDSQLARDFNISLPREFTLEQNKALIHEFVKNEFVSKGMIADVCIHDHIGGDGERQPHAHVMLTMRKASLDGFEKKAREWNSKENLECWRESWANTANRHFALHGFDIRIDHRTLAEQGIDLEPQYKIGTAEAQAHMVRFEDHQRIARENGEKLLKEPEIALHAITRNQSTFTHQDLARFVNRHSVDAEQFEQVYEKIKSSHEMVFIGIDDKGRERYTTHTMLALESQMMENASKLNQNLSHHVDDRLKEAACTTRTLTTEQTAAFEHILSEGNLKSVVGFAGTGKSYLLGAAREAWIAAGYRVQGATLSGIAAENLQQSSGIESRTVASFEYHWDRGNKHLTSKDILVIDEAGMLGSRQMARLVQEAHDTGAKIVLIGDPRQLQAIEAGAAFRAISRRHGYAELSEIYRQKEDWQREATKELALGKTMDGIHRYQEHGHVHSFETQALAKQAILEHWQETRIESPDKTQIMLTTTRDDAHDLNALARQIRKENGELGFERRFAFNAGERDIAVGERIYFLKNNTDLDVKNGTMGTVVNMYDNRLLVQLDNPDRKPVEVDITKYRDIDYSYAATTHKAQGVTVDKSYVLASKYMDSHGTYVGMSRHKEEAHLIYSREEFANDKELHSALSRDREKDVTLDYTKSPERFAEHRGLTFAEKLQDKEHAIVYTPEKHLEEKKEFSHHHDIASQKTQTPELEKPAFSTKREIQDTKQEHNISNKDAIARLYDKRALDAEKHLQTLEKSLETSRMPKTAKQELEKYAAKIAKDTEIMKRLENNKTLTERIKKHAKEHEKSRERERGSRGIDR